MQWSNLEIVLAIDRGQSLTRAAAILGIDQSTVGRRLSALERDLGTVLFVRSKVRLMATESGKTVIAHAKQVEAELETMRDKLAQDPKHVSGTVRLFTNPWIFQRLAGAKLRDFFARFPNI
jgi:DNA-binding transcriptional LysR family regulator